MKRNKIFIILGSLLLAIAIGLFCLQTGYLVLHERLMFEYIDDRLFYLINIFIVICLYLSLIILFTFARTFKVAFAGVLSLFIIFNLILLVQNNREINNIINISPDFKRVFSIKENISSGEAIYYRSYYVILGRPKERLDSEITGDYQVDWLANDIAAFTYKNAEDSVQQFIGTYGDRKNGISYYNVGAEIHGEWQEDNVSVISDSEGIRVKESGETSFFKWDDIEQFGTLAIVLKEKDSAAYTIALNKDFTVHSDASKPNTGNIILYKAAIGKHQAYHLNDRLSK